MKKFLFDVHNFDVGDEDGNVAPPPPPTFTLEEFTAAKTAAYEQGRQDGLREGLANALARIEQHTADSLAAIRDHFAILFDAEDRRSRTFEKESVQLAHTIFAKAFPALNRQFGLDEVRDAITGILETVHEQPEIIIDVPPDQVEPVQHHINGLLRAGDGPRCTVRGNDSLQPGQCRMGWTNGSAMRDGMHLAGRISAQIEHVLADKAVLTDNEDGTTATAPSAATDHGERNG